jgi:hypothetical protein
MSSSSYTYQSQCNCNGVGCNMCEDPLPHLEPNGTGHKQCNGVGCMDCEPPSPNKHQLFDDAIDMLYEYFKDTHTIKDATRTISIYYTQKVFEEELEKKERDIKADEESL